MEDLVWRQVLGRRGKACLGLWGNEEASWELVPPPLPRGAPTC